MSGQNLALDGARASLMLCQGYFFSLYIRESEAEIKPSCAVFSRPTAVEVSVHPKSGEPGGQGPGPQTS